MASTRNDVPLTVNRRIALSELISLSRTCVPGAHPCGRRVSRPSSVAIPSNVCATSTRSKTPGGLLRGSMTIAPKRPRWTSSDETWCVWYQNVPTWSARKRYV